MTKELYSLADVAKLLNAKPFTLHYMLSTGSIAEPKLRVAGRRVWTLAEINPIREKLKRSKEAEQRRKEGGDHE